MLITEEVMILMAKPRGMVEGWDRRRAMGLIAGAVSDLLAMDRLVLSASSEVAVLSTTPTDRPPLDHVLAAIDAHPPRTLAKNVKDKRLSPEDLVADSLTKRGALVRDRAGFLGLFPSRYKVLDKEGATAVQERLNLALESGFGGWHDAAVLSILNGVGVLRQTIAGGVTALGDRELSRRVDTLAEGSQMGRALRAATRDIGSGIAVLGAGGM